uniref:Ovule protein n=1 Tax=Mesocestoides corti TaxID=53468 RepID=A0A5K3FMI2_MESCO
MSPASRIINSPFISPKIYPGLSPQLDLDVSSSISCISEIQKHACKRHTRHNDTDLVERWRKRLCLCCRDSC